MNSQLRLRLSTSQNYILTCFRFEGYVSTCLHYTTQHTTHNTQHTTHNTQHTTHNTQHTTHNTQPTNKQQHKQTTTQTHLVEWVGGLSWFIALACVFLILSYSCSFWSCRRASLAGTLPLQYCAARFACKTPTWRLPVSGHVVDLVTADVGAVRGAIVDGAGQEVHWVSGSGPGRKRVRPNRKTPAHLVGLSVHSRPRVWRMLHCSRFIDASSVDYKRRRCNQHELEDRPVHPSRMGRIGG